MYFFIILPDCRKILIVSSMYTYFFLILKEILQYFTNKQDSDCWFVTAIFYNIKDISIIILSLSGMDIEFHIILFHFLFLLTCRMSYIMLVGIYSILMVLILNHPCISKSYLVTGFFLYMTAFYKLLFYLWFHIILTNMTVVHFFGIFVRSRIILIL